MMGPKGDFSDFFAFLERFVPANLARKDDVQRL